MQSRTPLGGGPSRNRCPKCSPHRPHTSSPLPLLFWTASEAMSGRPEEVVKGTPSMVLEKAGQPEPDSYMWSELYLRRDCPRVEGRSTPALLCKRGRRRMGWGQVGGGQVEEGGAQRRAAAGAVVRPARVQEPRLVIQPRVPQLRRVVIVQADPVVDLFILRERPGGGTGPRGLAALV